MIKFIAAAIWICAATLGAVFYSFQMSAAKPATEEAAKPLLGGLDYVKTDVISVPVEGIRPELPAFRLPDQTLYGRPEVNSLLLGGWEPQALSLDPRGYALAEQPPAIEEDWPVLSNFAELMAPFYPPAGDAGIRRVMSGWPTPTPPQKSLKPPPVPVLSMIGVLKPLARPNSSATAVAKG